MSSNIIAAYVVFCVIVLAVINMTLRRKKNDKEVEQIVEHKTVEEVSVRTPLQEENQSQQSAAAVAVNVEDHIEEEKAVKPKQEKQVREGVDKSSNKGVMLVILIVGMFVSILNQTVINVVLPELINEFSISATTGQWLSTGFMLVNGILVPISVYLVQTFSYRKLFLTAMLFFVVGSFVCAIATNFPIMMTGRVIQAIGAGILMPIGMNIFLMLFPPEKRGVAMGLLGVALILAPAIGPTIAGWLTQNYSWNIMFYIMFGLGFVIFLVALRFFALSQPLSKPKFDTIGAIASSIGLGCLLFGFSEAGSKGWTSGIVMSMLLIGVIGLVIFTMWEFKTETKLLDMSIFAIPAFSFTLIINVIVTMSMFGAMILLPVYLQNIRGFTPMESGILLMPGSLLMGLMGPFAGRLYDRVGIRPLAVFGLAIITFCTYEFTHLSMDTSYNHIMLLYTLRSFGMAFLMMPIMTAGINTLERRQIPHGTAAQSTLRSVAGSIGTAILVTVMTQQSTLHAAEYANEVTAANPVTNASFNQTGHGIAALAHIPDQMGSVLERTMMYGQMMKISTVEGINDAFWVATVGSALALVLSFFLKGKKREAIKSR